MNSTHSLDPSQAALFNFRQGVTKAEDEDEGTAPPGTKHGLLQFWKCVPGD